jgi:hypothetical protein
MSWAGCMQKCPDYMLHNPLLSEGVFTARVICLYALICVEQRLHRVHWYWFAKSMWKGVQTCVADTGCVVQVCRSVLRVNGYQPVSTGHSSGTICVMLNSWLVNLWLSEWCVKCNSISSVWPQGREAKKCEVLHACFNDLITVPGFVTSPKCLLMWVMLAVSIGGYSSNS